MLCVLTACDSTPVEPPAVPTTIMIEPAAAKLSAVGESIQLSAVVKDQNDQVMAGVAVFWGSHDPVVATVSTDGLVTAVSNGSVRITASAGTEHGDADVTVEQKVAAVEVVPAFDTLFALGDTVRFSAEATDANGNSVAEPELAWTTDDESIATVDSDGLVTAVGNGATEVVARAAEVAASAAVNVWQIPRSIAVSTATVTLNALGDTARLVAVVTDANGNPVAEPELAWATDDESIATVDSDGLVTAVGNGATEVVATAGEVAASVAVNVRQTPSSIAVSPATGIVWVGRDDLQLAATVFDANGHVLTSSPPIRWSSSDTAVVRVEPVRGVVTGLAEGTATITAMSEDAAGTATITVKMRRRDPYPIHVTYLGNVPELIRQEMDRAATAWGDWLAPTPSAPYVITQSLSLNISSDLSPSGLFLVHYEAGDTLAPGLNVWVTTREGPAWGWAWASYDVLEDYVRSDVPTAPWAVVMFNWQAIQRVSGHQARRELAYETAVHEIGHAVGIGTSPRWRRHFETPDSTKPWDSFFTDSVTIAVFDNMGGADFPSKKIPLSHDGAHWDGCAGHFDVMGNHRNETSTITELSLAAMAEGYEYDPGLVPRRRLDRNSWNSGSCKGGRWKGPSDQGARYRVWGFGRDVIRDSGRGRL